VNCLSYRTDEYIRLEENFANLAKDALQTRVISSDSSELVFGPLERIRGNTGNYAMVENK
jgi:hypothetical protein